MSNMVLRRAEKGDLDILFKWANDKTTRENSFNADPIPYENHVVWFNKILEDSSVLQYILEDEGIPVGQIRLTIEGSDAEIGYSIADEFRGMGYGHKILELCLEDVKSNYPNISILTARVKPSNIASKKLFEAEGYVMQYHCYSMKIEQNKG